MLNKILFWLALSLATVFFPVQTWAEPSVFVTKRGMQDGEAELIAFGLDNYFGVSWLQSEDGSFRSEDVPNGIGNAERIKFQGLGPAGNYQLFWKDRLGEVHGPIPVNIPAVDWAVPEFGTALNNWDSISCAQEISLDVIGICFAKDILKYLEPRSPGISTSRATNALEEILRRRIFKPLQVVSCEAQARAIKEALAEFPPDIAARYPAQVTTCDGARELFANMLGVPVQFAQCETWQGKETLAACFSEVNTAFELGLYQRAAENYVKHFTHNRSLRFIQASPLAIEDPQVAKIGTGVAWQALRTDAETCFRGRKFENHGFMATLEARFDASQLYGYSGNPLWVMCPDLMEVAYAHKVLSDSEYEEWLAIVARVMEREEQLRRQRELERERQRAEMQIFIAAQEAARRADEAYRNSPEGKLGAAVVENYNQTELPGLCRRVSQALSGATANPIANNSIRDGSLYQTGMDKGYCKVTMFLGASARFRATYAKVDNCTDGQCDIDLWIGCDSFGVLAAPICDSFWEEPYRGSVRHDGNFGFEGVDLSQ